MLVWKSALTDQVLVCNLMVVYKMHAVCASYNMKDIYSQCVKICLSSNQLPAPSEPMVRAATSSSADVPLVTDPSSLPEPAAVQRPACHNA